MLWLALALTCLLLAPSALAHKPSDSYLTLGISGQVLTGRWDIAVRDLDFVLGLDGNADDAVTWGELKERHPSVAAYALERLRVKVNGVESRPNVIDQSVDEHGDGTYAVMQLEFENHSRPHMLEVDYRLFFDHDPQHRGFLNLICNGQTQTALFSIEQPNHLFDLGEPSRWREWGEFVREGVWHIWIGFDHILFLLALLLPSVLQRHDGRWSGVDHFRPALINVLKIVTAFTVAHSITLALATFEIVQLPSRMVEAAIAGSVVLAALHNLFPVFQGRGWMAACCFGLIHGFGFAAVLRELGLAKRSLVLALVGFNVGVELGQLAIVAVFLPLAFLARRSWFYSGLTLRLGSACIALLATVWMIERILDRRWLPF